MTNPPNNPWLAVSFHGYGANAGDLKALMEYLFNDPACSIAHLDGPENVPFFPGSQAKCWFPLTEADFLGLASVDRAMLPRFESQATEAAHKAIESLPKFADLSRVKRISVLGFSQGSVVAQLAAQALIQMFLDQSLPALERIDLVLCSTMDISLDWNQAIEEVPLKIIQTHGLMDPVLPAAWSETMLREGHPHIKKLFFPDGHGIPPEAIDFIQTHLKEDLVNQQVSDA